MNDDSLPSSIVISNDVCVYYASGQDIKYCDRGLIPCLDIFDAGETFITSFASIPSPCVSANGRTDAPDMITRYTIIIHLHLLVRIPFILGHAH